MAEPQPLGFAGVARSVRTESAVALETGGGTLERATMKTLYDVLGVPRNANSERIRTAFRKAAKTYHPDLNAGDPTAEQQIKRFTAAYEILKSPHERAPYDQDLRGC